MFKEKIIREMKVVFKEIPLEPVLPGVEFGEGIKR